MGHISKVTPEEIERRLRRAASYGQNGYLVCLVHQKWNAAQSPNKKGFLNELVLMIRPDPDNQSDFETLPPEKRLFDEERTKLIVAVSTLLNIDREALQSETPYSPDALHTKVKECYGSEADSVEKFRNALIQEIGQLSTQR